MFVDDDPGYLQSMMDVLPEFWFLMATTKPSDCIEKLKPQTTRSEADAWRHQEMVYRWRDGYSLVRQVLDYWRDDGAERFDMVQVLLVDYAMPAMSALRLLSALQGWSGARVLLSGMANEHLALTAFNRGLIEKYIPKQLPSVKSRIVKEVKALRQLSMARQRQAWRATLLPEQQALLLDSEVSAALHGVRLREGWIEHVVIGAPFGVLGLNGKGGVSWLQLELPAGFDRLSKLAHSNGFDAVTVYGIRNRQLLIANELRKCLGFEFQPTAAAAFVIGAPFPVLYGAITQIPERLCPRTMDSYEVFFLSEDNHKVRI